MKRFIAIGLSVLMLVGFSAHAAYELSDSAKESYLKWIEKGGGSWTYALAVSPNGGYAAGWGQTIYEAKKKALKECKKFTKSTSCKIMDVDGKTSFIKQRGSSSYSSNSSSSYSSTASSSGNSIYCFDGGYKSFYRVQKPLSCGHNRQISKREFTNKRLDSSSSSSSYSSTASRSGNSIYCFDGGYKSFYRVQKPLSCGHNRQISKREFTNKRLDSSSSSTASNSSTKWCTTSSRLWQITNTSASTDYCTGQGGFVYASEVRAQAAHELLKAASTPVIKTASLTIRSNVTGDRVYIDGNFKGSTRLDLKLSKGRHTIRIEKDGYKTYEEGINLTDNLIIRGHLIKIVDEPVQTVVVDNTFEVQFWDSIKTSDDPDEYRIYLDEYPTGKFAKLAKLRIKKLGGTTTSVAKASIPNLDYGDYFALVIGNNRYDHLSQLRTAVSDARSVANLLELDYGFNVTKLENANREQIIDSISGLRSKVTSEDNVLIYYAGHGYLDEAADEGFWLPTDSDRTNQSNWLATDRIVGQVRAMKAKHVMIVADSCFSGTITRGIKIEIKQPTREWLETIVKKKARTALTSGGLEPVMDSGGGNNSVFANSFLSILRDNDGVLDASQLFSQLRPKVMVNSDQTPEYGDIHRAGHDGGDFLFVRQ